MPSSIFGNSNQGRGTDLHSLLNAMRNGNPGAVAQQMMESNPQFRRFVEQNRGKSPEQVAKEHGVDLNMFR